MFNQFQQFTDLIKNNPNPEAFVMQMLEKRAKENPVYSNLLSSVQKNDTKQVEAIVKNIARERGIDFDKEFNSFKQMFRR